MRNLLLRMGKPASSHWLLAKPEPHRENSLTLHGRGRILGVLRLALSRVAPSGGAQDDTGGGYSLQGTASISEASRSLSARSS